MLFLSAGLCKGYCTNLYRTWCMAGVRAREGPRAVHSHSLTLQKLAFFIFQIYKKNLLLIWVLRSVCSYTLKQFLTFCLFVSALERLFSLTWELMCVHLFHVDADSREDQNNRPESVRSGRYRAVSSSWSQDRLLQSTGEINAAAQTPATDPATLPLRGSLVQSLWVFAP